MLNVGMKIRVKSVLIESPPMTVMAKGAPMLPTYSALPMARGIMATIVVMAVMRIGRIRAWPAIMRALAR